MIRFTGSAGTAVISRTGAHLFTDSRYYTQATRELDGNWTLHKVGFTPDIQPWNEWVRDRPRGSRVGIDSRLISQGPYLSIPSPFTPFPARWTRAHSPCATHTSCHLFISIPIHS